MQVEIVHFAHPVMCAQLINNNLNPDRSRTNQNARSIFAIKGVDYLTFEVGIPEKKFLQSLYSKKNSCYTNG